MCNEDVNPDPKDLEQIMSAEEQAAVWRAGVLAHFETVWAELQATIAELKERPDLVAPGHVMLVKSAVTGLMEWLRANGIDACFEVTSANGLDVQAGDRL